ncbi:MAG: hypothetical protein LBK99_08225 [Opitutaceae bacterium]|jgi:hypothetical protein|nr:hypothetical protein [Opitutaceae bacterium]
MTPQEQAKAWALENTGLRWENLAAWTPAQRDAYLAANAQFRRDNPALFTPAEQAAADTYASFAATQLPEVDWVDVTLDALGASVVGRAGGYATAKKRARRKHNNIYTLVGRNVSRKGGK